MQAAGDRAERRFPVVGGEQMFDAGDRPVPGHPVVREPPSVAVHEQRAHADEPVAVVHRDQPDAPVVREDVAVPGHHAGRS
jgi:hypothetical protein